MVNIYGKTKIFIPRIPIMDGSGMDNFFEVLDYLEPRCGKCGAKIEYGLTTEFNEEKGCHMCLSCGTLLK